MIKKITLIAFFASFTIHAQQTVDASGGDATGSGGSASYSVGQIVYTTHTGSNGSISQGVQQSYEIFTLSNAALSTVNLVATTYPNPTSGVINISLAMDETSKVEINVINSLGQVVLNDVQSTDGEISLDLSNLPTGLYSVQVGVDNNVATEMISLVK